MATASLSPLPISNSGHLFSPKFLVSRNHASNYRRKCKLRHKIVSSSCFPMMPSSNLGFTKRGFMLFSFYSSLELILPSYGFAAAEDLKMAALVDDINAYTYLYPVEIPSKKFVFKWVESRKPERYSSAAPLSANARLRIVSERVDIIDNLIISISIGPLNAELLKSKDKRMWTAKDIADSVLSDKSALRVTSSQRLAESSLLDAHSSEVDGEPYWYYEYLVRKSPTKSIQEPNIYRQYVASTAERDGYLYTLNASTLSKQWESVEAQTNRRGLAYSYGQSLSSVQDVNPKTKSSTVHASQR